MNFCSETLKQEWISIFTIFHLFYTLAAGVWTVSINASFGNSVRGFRWRAPVLKHEWILNCTTPTRFLGKESWRYIDQISHRLLLWYLEYNLNSEIRIKYAETVHSCNIQTIPFFALIRNFLLNSSASQTHRRRVPELHADHPAPSTVSVG